MIYFDHVPKERYVVTTRRDFLIKSGQLVALGTVGSVLASCSPSNNKPIIEHKLPSLTYNYKDLEPHIDAQTMEIHYSKHHQGYVNKLNKALSGHNQLQTKTIVELLKDLNSIPKKLQEGICNNGGGHYNHSLFWESMSPSGGGNPEGALKSAIEEQFQSVDNFKSEFFKATKSVFGSGWGWLVCSGDKLEITTTANQENPISGGKAPLLGLDVWEHAYYLNYQNKRGDYINAWWNVVDWKVVSNRYDKAKG